jgi:hypothetical protein
LPALTSVVVVVDVGDVRVEKGQQDVAALTGTAAKHLLSGSGVKTGADSTSRFAASERRIVRNSTGRQVLDHRGLLAFEKIKAPIFANQFAIVPGILNKEGAGADGRVAQI